jgi:hypothetical protein
MCQCHDSYDFEGYEPVAAGSVPGTQCHDEPAGEAVIMAEVTLANSVREWCERVAPGDEATSRAGVETALCLYASGASVSEACDRARRMVFSRLRHPSNARSRRHYAAAS